MTKSGKHSKIFYQNNQFIIELSKQTRSIFRTSELPLSEREPTSEQANNFFLTTDKQNSVLQKGTNQRPKYGPYGQDSPIIGRSTLLGFNGQYRQLTGLYALGNGYRSYSPILMRFYSTDNLSPFDAGGLNAYAYCSGDPINFTDATGHMRRNLTKPNRKVGIPSGAPTSTTTSDPQPGHSRSMLPSDGRPESASHSVPQGTTPHPPTMRSTVEPVSTDLAVETSLMAKIAEHIQQGHHVHLGREFWYTPEYKNYNQFTRTTVELISNTSKRQTEQNAKKYVFKFVERTTSQQLDPKTKAKILREYKTGH
ncbi:RHS repeat-associated core domain-containing protein [Pseudomonas monteilii]|uniref:RHS repeat-associated core domain-containing protein n=1 Tax=Pseudomonas monteilii TaxID=76759 RepID=UPI003804FAA6